MSETSEPAGDLSPALSAITQFAGWINHADTKAGLLAAGVTVLVAGLAQRPAAIALALRAETDMERWALATLILLAVSLATTIWALGTVIFPRFSRNPEASRFSYPYVSATALDEIRIGDAATVADEAWLQAQTLAGIAFNKFTRLRRGIVSFAVSVAAFLGWIPLAALIAP